MLKKLRVRFICINMAIVTVMLAVIFGLVLHFTGNSLERESIRMMQSVGQGPAHLPRPGELQDGVRLPYFFLQVTPQGELKVGGNSDFDLSDTVFLQEIFSASYAQQAQTGVLEDYNLRFYKTGGPGPQTLVFADMTSEQATLHNLMRTCVAIGIIGLAGFFVISLFLARWAVKPVDEAWNQQKQFVADASQELKTPLTVILTNSELLQSGETNQELRQQCADNISVMAGQMRGLVENLLDLARADNGQVQTAMTLLDYSELVSDCLLPFEPVFFEKGMELKCDIASDLFVRGSDGHLRQVVDILLDNAQKYAFPGGGVGVTLRKQGSHCLLAVANQGPTIPEEELKNIFKRFYRADKARSRDGSYGLGLSIAQRVVEEHGGRITADSRNNVNTFQVLLPLATGRKGNKT